MRWLAALGLRPRASPNSKEKRAPTDACETCMLFKCHMILTTVKFVFGNAILMRCSVLFASGSAICHIRGYQAHS